MGRKEFSDRSGHLVPCQVAGDLSPIWICGNVYGGVLGDCIGGMPVSQREFYGDGCVVGQLLKFGSPVMFSAWDANGCGANVAVAMLVVKALSVVRVEVQFDVNRIG